ncbi:MULTISPECIES: hypothetical protein [unclassified Streptomyces]|uniref:hypothetical protein n=1 Tax=unclassified Streptomyces TaxID=2593676 RepID=UPI0038160024
MRTERSLVVIAALSMALITGCGANEEKAPEVPKTATGSLEKIAKQAKCDAHVSIEAEDLRQGNCTTDEGKWVLATFATDRGLREWINEAKDYGGSYLVGRKWVAVGDEKLIQTLRGRLGGTVETGTSHHSSGEGSSEGSSSGGSGDMGKDGGHSGHDMG